MSKFYEVRCTASADITELWRVQADSEDQAIELIGEGQGDFIRQCDVDEERDRRDWQADEILPYEYETLGQWDQMQAAAPDMLAALENALPWLIKADIDGAFNGCALPLGGRKAWEQIERAIAKAKGVQS